MSVPVSALCRSAAALLLSLAVATGSSISVADAQQADANPDPVFVFNRICYAQVPNVRAIEDMALRLAWKQMGGEDLKGFAGKLEPEKLLGWDVQVGERLFRVGVTQSKPPEGMARAFPDFAEGTSTSCSIVLDDQQLASDFMPNMQRLAGKEPVSRDVKEGLLLTTTWAGGNDELKVFLIAKAPPTGKGGLLNVTVLEK